MATTQEQLDEVQVAISACLLRQSYSAAERTLLAPDLAKLTERENGLLERLAGEAGGGMMASLGQIDRPI